MLGEMSSGFYNCKILPIRNLHAFELFPICNTALLTINVQALINCYKKIFDLRDKTSIWYLYTNFDNMVYSLKNNAVNLLASVLTDILI